MGWLLFGFYLAISFVFNSFNNDSSNKFIPISWSEQVKVYEGALVCSLLPEEMTLRIEQLKSEVFSQTKEIKELEDGYTFYFEDDEQLLTDIFDFVELEKKCCPFFQFDVSVQPFQNGFAVRVGGSKLIKEFVGSYLDIS